MKIIEKSITDLKPYEKNPRKNADAVEYVKNSIKEFGFKNPIIIDKDNVIIAGHTRLLAAKELGLEKVPCIMADDLSEDQIKAFRLADNKTAEFASWDLGLLADELINIDLDMLQFGFEETEQKETETPEVEFTEELREEHNYVVLYFDNEVDWLQCESILQLDRVSALPTSKKKSAGKFNRIGVGRVINGAKAMELMRDAYIG